jgi:hypothetical protein
MPVPCRGLEFGPGHPGPNSGKYEVPEMRGQSVRNWVFSYAKRSNAAAKDENPTTLDGSLVVRLG